MTEMRNYALDTKMLPKVWVTWASTKNGKFNKRYWLNCQTGVKKTKPESWMIYNDERDAEYRYWSAQEGHIGCFYRNEKSDRIWVKSGSNLMYAYAKYHKDIDRLEIAAVGIDTSRKAEGRTWEFIGDRFFIGKDKTILGENGCMITRQFNVYKHHTAYDAKNMLSMMLRLHIPKGFLNEFKKFIGENYFTVGNGTTTSIEYDWHIQRWYMTSQKVRGKGKQQKLTDNLVQMPLTDVSEFEDKLVSKEIDSCGYKRYVDNIIYFERVNDEWSVLRSFHRGYDHSLTEEWRMYINDNGNNRIVSNSKDGWIPSKQIHDGWNRRTYICNQDEAIKKCNRIKYALGSNCDVGEGKIVNFLVTSLRFPEIEQMCKLGYVDKAKSIASSTTPKADIKNLFGGYFNEKEKNLLRKVGLTKQQLDCYMSHDGYRLVDALREMRKMFGNDLSYMDIDSFKKYYKGHVQCCERYWRGYDKYMHGYDLDKMRFFKNIVRLAERRENAVQIAFDTLSAHRNLNLGTAPEIDWYFEDYSDLTRAHDVVTELKRIQDDERRAIWDAQYAERQKKEEELRIKMDKERKNYEYEDDNYIIRLPKDSNEIVNEGSVQHICIGGYTTRHASAQTNLFFLRKKDEPDMPFYAIEMNNNKSIVQIHGFGNKWLGNNPEAIPTVVRWLRKHGISCDEAKLTCTARGYCSTNNYVPMPVVD